MPTPPFPSSPPFLPHHFKLAVVSCVLFFGRATQLPADVRRRYAGGHVLSDLQSCPELGPRGLLRRKVPTLMLRGGHGSGHDDSSAISQQPAEVGNRLFAHITTSRGSMEAESDSTSKAGQVECKRGGVLSWGIGIHGRLGTCDWVDRFQPCRALEQLCGEVVQVSAGDYHSLALCRNGSVFAFGSNGRGQLGDGTKEHCSYGKMVPDLDEGFVKVSAGGFHSLALHAEGFVLVWGENTTGQVGQSLNAFEDETVIRHRGWPMQVATPVIPRFLDDDVVDIAAGHLHSLALLSDGRILAWGNNIYGQLGIGKNLTFPPYDVEDEDEIEARSDAFQRCRRDQIAAFENLPMKVLMPPLSSARRRASVKGHGSASASGILDVKKIAAGGWHSLALVSSDAAPEGGGVYAWGQNYLGQLGTGYFTCWDVFDKDDDEEEDVEEEDDDFELKPKSRRAGARRADGKGIGDVEELQGTASLFDSRDDSDQEWATRERLAQGGWHDALEPVQCLSHQDLQSEVVDIAAGHHHSLALLANGSVLSWGSNQAGQLGVPLRRGTGDASGVSGGGGAKSDVGLAAVGGTWQEEVEANVHVHPDNGLPFRTTPALVEGLPGPAVSISAGFAHSAAVLADGRIFTWGANFDGQLGQGSIDPCRAGAQPRSLDALILPGDHRPRQVLVPGEKDAIKSRGGGEGRAAFAVSSGSSHSLALVGQQEWSSYPAADSNATGMLKNWWPCLRDWVEREHAAGSDRAVDPHHHALGTRPGSSCAYVRARDPPSALEDGPEFQCNLTQEAMALKAGVDLSPQPLVVSGPEDLFQTTRTLFNNDASVEAVRILPNVMPVVVQDERWPALKTIEWKWKNVTEEEAEQAKMPYPQIYRGESRCVHRSDEWDTRCALRHLPGWCQPQSKSPPHAHEGLETQR